MRGKLSEPYFDVSLFYNPCRGGVVIAKKINPHTTRHGDSLAYLGQKSQLHHVSKVDLKQWPEGSTIFFFFFTNI